VVRILSPNGGGWGKPEERDPRRIAEDIRNGLIGLDEAVKVYKQDRAELQKLL
jgi:N-methylhydantoinase B